MAVAAIKMNKMRLFRMGSCFKMNKVSRYFNTAEVPFPSLRSAGMNRLLGLLLACFCAVPGWAKTTVILLEGQPLLQGKALALGQRLPDKGLVESGPEGSVHLVLAGGASVVLAADSVLDLAGMKLVKGTAAVLTESPVAIRGADAVGQSNGGHFEFSVLEDSATLSVMDGEARLADSRGRKSEAVRTLQQARYFSGRLERAQRLGKREAGELRSRWQRSIVIHGQRKNLLEHFSAG
jgi:hypothetical protein